MLPLRSTAAIVLVLLIVTTPSQSANTTSDSSAQSDANSFNKALNPLYSMSDGFLHAVFPSGADVDTIGKSGFLWRQL